MWRRSTTGTASRRRKRRLTGADNAKKRRPVSRQPLTPEQQLEAIKLQIALMESRQAALIERMVELKMAHPELHLPMPWER